MTCCNRNDSDSTKHTEPSTRRPAKDISRPATITTPQAPNKKVSRKPALPIVALTMCATYQPTCPHQFQPAL